MKAILRLVVSQVKRKDITPVLSPEKYPIIWGNCLGNIYLLDTCFTFHLFLTRLSVSNLAGLL